jgi:hypothetical protein
MASRTFDVKFPCGIQLTFGSLTFAAGEDGDLKMLLPGSAPEHPAPASSSASDISYVGSDRCAGNYIRIVKIIRGISVVTSILQPLAGASSSSTSASTPYSDSSDDYPEIGGQRVRGTCERRSFYLWWPRMVIGQTTSPADIPPLGDQRQPMPEH